MGGVWKRIRNIPDDYSGRQAIDAISISNAPVGEIDARIPGYLDHTLKAELKSLYEKAYKDPSQYDDYWQTANMLVQRYIGAERITYILLDHPDCWGWYYRNEVSGWIIAYDDDDQITDRFDVIQVFHWRPVPGGPPNVCHGPAFW